MKRGSFNIISILLLGLGLCIRPLHAQEPQFVATVSATKVAQHTVVEVQFELQEAKGTDFQPPSFDGFRVVGGPSLGSSTMVINGVVSSSQSWSYSLLATKQGRFTIGPASVVAGRKKLMTRPLTIEVVKPNENSPGNGTSPAREPIFLRAETDADHYVPGQQIVLQYKLLFRENIQTVSTLEEDDYADFFVQPFSGFSDQATTEYVNGIPFTSRIVKAVALYAHQSGTYTLDPMIMNVGVNAPFPGNHGLFSMRRIMDVQVASEPLTIRILPLPPNAPASFTGAVGQYSLDIMPIKSQLTTDEALSFELRITGDGDARRWDLPVPVTSDSVELFDPKIISEKAEDHDGRVSHTRSVLYQLLPAHAGPYIVHVPFTYYDPAAAAYRTISSDTLTFDVRQGSGIKPFSSASPQDTSSHLPLMKTGREWLSDRFWTSIPHLFLFAVVLSGVSFGFYASRKRQREDAIPRAERLKRQAYEAAIQALDQLNAEGAVAMTDRTWYERITGIYHLFLMHRFAIPAGELDEIHLHKALTGAQVDAGVVQRAVDLFQQSLTFRYGLPGAGKAAETLTSYREIISALR